MTTFLDSSAVVKRYSDEPSSDLVRTVDGPVIASELALVEVPSALWRKRRMGEISAQDAQTLWALFLADVSDAASDTYTQLVRLSRDVLSRAAQLTVHHPLRALDALQLASALATAAALDECAFGCFDDRLNTAAASEGLPLRW